MAQVAKARGEIAKLTPTRRHLDMTNVLLIILAIFIGLTLVIDLNLLKPVSTSAADSAQYISSSGSVSKMDNVQHPTATPDDDCYY